MYRVLLIILLILPSLLQAREISMTGSITTGTSKTPVQGVKVSVVDPSGLHSEIPASDVAGQIKLSLSVPENLRHHSPYVIVRFQKQGFHPLDIYQRCNLQSAATCVLEEVVISPVDSISTLSSDEKNVLSPKMSPEGNTLYLIPYRVLPKDSSTKIDMELFAFSLQTAINIRLQELEEDFDFGSFEPLPPISLESLGDRFSSGTLAKRQAIGEFVKALALIDGIGQWKVIEGEQDRISIHSDFLIIPPDAHSNARILQVRDTDLSAVTLNSIELADNLSPLWGHYALVAVAGREYAKAKASSNKQALKRIRGYLIAERGQLRAGEKYKLRDLNRLLKKVNEAMEL